MKKPTNKCCKKYALDLINEIYSKLPLIEYSSLDPETNFYHEKFFNKTNFDILRKIEEEIENS